MLRSRTMLGEIAMGLCVIAALGSCSGGGSAGLPLPGGPGGVCGEGCKAPQACDVALGCVECAADGACPAGRPRCILGRCEVCATSADCPASLPACFPQDHTCHGACTAGNCPGSTTCDAQTGVCAGCSSTTDCAGTPKPFCSPQTGACVACLDNTHCGAAAPYCFV